MKKIGIIMLLSFIITACNKASKNNEVTEKAIENT